PDIYKDCSVCGKTFLARHGRRKYCSLKCQNEKNKRGWKRNGRIYFPLIDKFNIVDRKVRRGFMEHHINNFCVVPCPVIPHFNAGCGSVKQHRDTMRKWMLKLWVMDFDEMIRRCL
ncbi:unnamed protein product, partial [marine sediment metagenome]